MSRIGTPAGDTLPAGVLCHGDVGSRGRWITKALDHENAKGREDTKHEGREEAGSRRREEARRHAHSGVLRKSAKGAKMVRATLSSCFRASCLRVSSRFRGPASLRDFVVQRLFAISWSSVSSRFRGPAPLRVFVIQRSRRVWPFTGEVVAYAGQFRPHKMGCSST